MRRRSCGLEERNRAQIRLSLPVQDVTSATGRNQAIQGHFRVVDAMRVVKEERQDRNEGTRPSGKRAEGRGAGRADIILNNINDKVREVPVDWMRRHDAGSRGVPRNWAIAPG